MILRMPSPGPDEISGKVCIKLKKITLKYVLLNQQLIPLGQTH